MQLLNQESTLITLDFETYWGTGYSLGLQAMNTFKYVADEQFKIHGVGVKVNDETTRYFDFHDPSACGDFSLFLDSLADRNGRTVLLCHNTAFDAFILSYHFDWTPDFYLDTASMSRGMFIGQSASLKELALRLWPNEPSLRKLDTLDDTRNLRELPEEIREPFAQYCIRDVDLTHAAFKLMEPHYPEDELALIDWTLRSMCEPRLRVDTALVQDEIDYQVNKRRDTIAACPLTETQLKSDAKFREWLEDHGVGIEMKRNVKDTDDIPALGQSDWGYQRMCAAHPELESVWAARKVAKSNIQESRARWFKSVADWNRGFMPVPLKYYGADTGRWSGTEKLNLQNLPRNNNGDTITDPNSGRLRRALMAPKGQQVIVRDLNNIEGRMLAWEANETYLLDLFRNGGCPYLYMAESIYNAPHGTFSKATHGGERNVGKVATLGLGYGMGANKFWTTVNTGPMGMDPIPMSFEDASRVVNIYRSTNAQIANFWQLCDGAIMQMASLDPGATYEFGPVTLMRNLAILPNGMALQYAGLEGEPNQWGGFDFTFGNNKKIYGGLFVENLTQALARVLIGQQLLHIQDELDRNYGRDAARVVHMVHDELVVLGPDKDAEDIYTMMGEVMSQPPAWALDLPLKSEGGIAQEYSK